MKNQAFFQVFIAGANLTGVLTKHLQSIKVSDRAGTSGDGASIIIDASSNSIEFPKKGAPVVIFLGWKGKGSGVAFSGTVDVVKFTKSRSGGKKITIAAKGFDTASKIKEPQHMHFDDMTIEAILKQAGEACGVSDVRASDKFKSLTRKYEQMDDESFLAFGERLAKELGATFKVRNDVAIFVEKNGGVAPNGALLPVVNAIYGENLHSCDISPFIGRHRYKEIRVKFYDKSAAKWDEVVVQTDIEDAVATAVATFKAPNRQEAEEKANSMKAEIERSSGGGNIGIEGDISAMPEGTIVVDGAYLGVDGPYRIDAVDHTYERGGGFKSSITIKQPLF